MNCDNCGAEHVVRDYDNVVRATNDAAQGRFDMLSPKNPWPATAGREATERAPRPVGFEQVLAAPYGADQVTEAPKSVDKKKLLDMANEAVKGRGLNYGKPEANFERIANRWRTHIENRYGIKIALDATSVAVMCADLKIARLENTPGHLDSWVDLAGYAACGAEIATN